MVTFFTEADVTGTGETVEAEVWLATEFTVPAGTLSALRWRFPAGIISVTPVMRIFNASGTALAIGTAGATSLAFDTSTAGQFNAATLPTPLVLTAGTYRATVNTTRYVFKSGFFTSGSITRGSITAVQGRFGSPGSAPSSTSTATYFPDIDFTATGSPAEPAGLAVPVGIGAPSVNAGLSVAPSGLAVAVGQGEPTVGQPSAVPDSLAVATGLGAPSITLAGSAPDGLSVAVGLGEPSVVTAYTVAPDSLSVPVGLGAPAIVLTSAPAGLAVPVGLGSPTVGQATGSGGWHDFGGIIQGAINDARINDERRRNPVECPVHGWPLKRTPRGLHCQFGGHVVAGGW